MDEDKMRKRSEKVDQLLSREDAPSNRNQASSDFSTSNSSSKDKEFKPRDDSEKDISPVNNPLYTGNLEFSTEHLKRFNLVKEGLKLQGDEYQPIRKTVWYEIYSMENRKLKAKINNMETDCRFHTAFIMPSGSGKKNIVTLMEKLFRENRGKLVAEPASFHPEQLIGKTVEAGKNKELDYIQNYGHLNDDLVIKDEAIDLFRSNKENYQTTRNYLNIALDPYGSNLIEKRMVDVPREETLSYMPDCNVIFFMQPFSVNQEFALQGTLRRFMIPFVELPEGPTFEAYEERIRDDGLAKEKAIESLADELDTAYENQDSGVIEVEDESLDLFIELHGHLVRQGFAHSMKGMNFTGIVDYQLQTLLLKMSGIQARANEHDKIRRKDLEKAFIDLTEIFGCMLDYVHHKIKGQLDYGEGWSGAVDKDRKCLEHLETHSAYSKEDSSLSISDYKSKIKDVFDVKKRQAGNHIKRHEDNGWIGREQTGQDSSVVWLKIDPADGKGGKGGNMVQKYREEVRENSPYFQLVEKYGG